MTTLQLRIVITAANLGSISTAAKELGISQPNASSGIKSLEEEIGFRIFSRAKSGINLTEKGIKFVEHARRILEENESIMSIKKHEDSYRLRLGTINYNSAVEPFLKLCEKHRDDKETDFRYFSVSTEEGIKDLVNNTLDIILAPSLQSQFTGVMTSCKQNNIDVISLGTLPATVSVRKGHPGIADGRCQNLIQGSDAMKDFPYIAYRNLTEDSGPTGYNDSDFVQCSYKMYVDESDIRLRLLGCTNGFAFGISIPEKVQNRYNIVSFPVPGISLEVFCLVRHIDRNRKEINEYMQMLKQELNL